MLTPDEPISDYDLKLLQPLNNAPFPYLKIFKHLF